MAATLNSAGNGGGFRTEPGEHLVPGTYWVGPESGQGADLNAHEVLVAPSVTVTDGAKQTDRGVRVVQLGSARDDELLPPGIDSHRYKCCGNGVIAPVMEWIGWRMRALIEGTL